MMSKKGLSDIVATVLIVLLALAAVAIIWGFVSGMIRNTGNSADAQSKCLNTEIKPTACTIHVFYTEVGGTAGQYDEGTDSIATESLKTNAVIKVTAQANRGTPTTFVAIAKTKDEMTLPSSAVPWTAKALETQQIVYNYTNFAINGVVSASGTGKIKDSKPVVSTAASITGADGSTSACDPSPITATCTVVYQTSTLPAVTA